MLDKSHQIIIKDLTNEESRKIEYTAAAPVNDIFYAGTGLILLKNNESISMFDIQQKRVLATAKVSKVRPGIIFIYWMDGVLQNYSAD